MPHRFVIACFVVMSCSTLEGIEPNAGGPNQMILPAILRPIPRLSNRNRRAQPIRSLSTFDLKLVVASGEDVIEFLPPMRVEDQNDTAPNLGDAGESVSQAPVFTEDPGLDNLPPLATSPQPFAPPPSPSRHAVPLDDVFREEDNDEDDKDDKAPEPASQRSSYGWMAGNQNHLGMLEIEFEPLSRARYDAFAREKLRQFYVDMTYGGRWLDGPNSPDLPPYLFNILINAGSTVQISDRFAFDAMISPGWYTDFSNKGVEAFRLPWHFVTFTKPNDEWQWVLGITDLSRRDIRLLPVAGFIYAPPSGDMRLDLVFPKPKVAWRAYECKGYEHGSFSIKGHEGWLYLLGELGGGSWAISRADRSYDVVTYRDYRLFGGYETKHAKGQASRIEIGWIFGRSVEYMSNLGNYNPTDTLMIRYSADY